MSGIKCLNTLKKNTMTILTKSLNAAMKAFRSLTKVILLILLALITCTCSGLKLTWAPQISGNQIDFSLYSGKHVKPINDVMVCATSKIDGLVFHSWHHRNSLIKQRYLPTHVLEYYQSQEPTLKKCLPIKLYPYQLTTHSFSNPYKTVWIGQKQNWHTGYQRQNLRGESLIRAKGRRSSKGSTQRSTGRTRVTTHMTVKSSSYLPTMNQVSGSVQITF